MISSVQSMRNKFVTKTVDQTLRDTIFKIKLLMRYKSVLNKTIIYLYLLKS